MLKMLECVFSSLLKESSVEVYLKMIHRYWRNIGVRDQWPDENNQAEVGTGS